MTKYLFLLLFIGFLPTFACAQSTNEFEEELRLLEKQDEAALKRVEDLSKQESTDGVDVVTDTVSVGRAAPLRYESKPDKTETIQEVIPEKKARRIRSR